MKVYASLTSIPSRMGLIRKCLDSLIAQEYGIEKIVLTLPLKNLRQQDTAYKIPKYLNEYPYKDKVIISRPPVDYGPVMKYIGGKDIIPANSLVFVCDDDQEYRPDLVSRLVYQYNLLKSDHTKPTIVASLCYRFLLTKTVNGYGGLIFNSKLISMLHTRITKSNKRARSACQFVDDNWVSITCKQMGIKIESLGLTKREIHLNGHKEPEDGLGKVEGKIGRYKNICNCSYTIDDGNYLFVIILILILTIIILNYK